MGLKIVALGKCYLTSYSPKYLVDKSMEAESGSAPAALKWISLITLGFLAQAFAIFLEISILTYSASPNFLTYFLGPQRLITTLEFSIALSNISSLSKSKCFIK